MNFNRIDLNLFVVFDAIYTTGSLTKAGEVLCITQPAVSNSLSRLRDLFNDPLFVRTGQTMSPSPVAQNIIGPAREALRSLRQCVQTCEMFDPAVADKTFEFSVGDLIEVALLSRLMAELQTNAPHLKIRNQAIAREDITRVMASGKLDFYADMSSFSDPYICKQKIAQDRMVVVARPDHPDIDGGVDFETFQKLNHLYISTRTNGASMIDVALDKRGGKRNVVMRGNHFITAHSAISKSQLICCLPYHFAKHLNLAIYEIPFEVPRLEYFLYWHISADQDPAHRWLRDEMAKIFEPLLA